MKAVTLKSLKVGDYFTLKPIEEPNPSQVYIRREYDRSERKYEVGKYSDANYWRYMKGDKIVYVDFYF